MDSIKAFSRTNIRYDGAEYSDYDDVAVEDTITLFVNDIRIATLIASPEHAERALYWLFDIRRSSY